ncbi:MAG: AAA family ATPase [Methylobacter sp.]|nr:AAA family ATPase [Methylobacter sp.]
MIRKLHINNYKSLHDLTLEVGRFNVFIGENGCGKSNLLEAIALAAAAAADKLDHEFLGSRGIRVTEPELMRSAFKNESLQEPIKIDVNFENLDILEKYTLINDNQPYANWIRYLDLNKQIQHTVEKELDKQIQHAVEEKLDKQIQRLIEDEFNENIMLMDLDDEIKEKLMNLDDKIRETLKSAIKENLVLNIKDEIIKNVKSDITTELFFKYNEEDAEKYLKNSEVIENNENKIKNFIIYSPENTALRNFYKEGQIEPLGINGEGLLKLLKVIQSKSPEQRQEIHTTLQLFDWYSELEIPKDLSASEDKVTITDRYLTMAFDQRSANEGFLFVLFYIALMVSDDTPKIFAIDNIDTSLNPKLCTKLIKELIRLAKKYDKQVFVTTHNPAILDGIDLGDDEQRLLVVSRNKQGHTRYKRITLEDKPRSSTNEDLKLSEAFLRGYLGGLPKGF